jgi:hypothetical protein
MLLAACFLLAGYNTNKKLTIKPLGKDCPVTVIALDWSRRASSGIFTKGYKESVNSLDIAARRNLQVRFLLRNCA